MIWLIAIAVSLFYASVVEYVVHRWVMHQPGLGKNHIWEEHAIQHHGQKRNDINIALSASTVTIGASPLFLFCISMGYVWAVGILVGCILYAALWSELHACYHGVGRKSVEKLPIYQRWMTHHINHHKHPSKNFGTIFIWTDTLFRTKV